jgi:hypothetical protein
MPYVMIPDGFSLKKVTRAQKEAVNAKRRHDDVLAILNNDNTPLVVGGLVAGFFAVQTTNSVIASLEERLGTLSDDVKQAVEEGVAKVEKELVTDPKNWFERKLDRSKKRLEELDLSRLA